MILDRYRPLVALSAAAVAAMVLAGCAGLGSGRRDERFNTFPDNYRPDLLGAMRAYVIDPTNIRDTYLSDPVIRKIGAQNRYTACVRYNAKNSDGRYVGSRDVMAIFVNGRFDQFMDLAPQPGEQSPSDAMVEARQACAQAEYKPFPELQALKR